ncbi:MAG: Single-stranded-DNA-specific exonuclease RecJ [Phycisphaerales bacterium]|nr:Single-stranded-DNA-specific exonuclease RecJ [Phycisphaerales bacterium]
MAVIQQPRSESPAASAASIIVQRGLTRRWRPRPCPPPQTGQALLQRVLAARGLVDPATAARFLDVRLNHLHDPSLIPDMDKAAQRLLDEVRRGGRVVIYGDYDVDGVTAIAILVRTVRAIHPGADIGWYIPHRVEEGYGLNREAIGQLCSSGANLIVSVDCGVTAIEPALVAARRGVDLIITDHHNPPASMDDLPRAHAVVHPRRPDSRYPFSDLSGAGVAYKLAWRLATLACGSSKVTGELRGVLIELLALAALGTIADVVPLVDENRVIARFGLGRIQHSSFVGLRSLVEASGLAGENVDAQGVGFKLAPRLNACGRMGHANEAAELLTTDDPAKAAQIAQGLTALNNARRRVEQAIFDRACELAVAAGMDRPDRRAIVLADDSWHTGVVGIVCSRMVEKYGRPCILLGRENNQCHGSGRSVEGFSLHAALVRCAEHLTSYGGHDMAAGMRVESAKLDAFTESFIGVANECLAPEDLCQSVEFDTDAALAELTVDAVRQFDRLEPFGRGNPPVRLRLRGLTVAEAPRLLGSTGKHMELRARDSSGSWTRLVAWNWGSRLTEIRAGHRIDAVVAPRVSDFNGPRVEPVIEDLCILRD